MLTDFESIKVFNTQDAKATLAAKLLFEISYDRYIECFDQLSLLSRESFEKNLIDTEAEKFGKKFQKIPVTSLLFNDLNECREILTKSLKAWNSKIAPQFLDEGVQKLLDRLIFYVLPRIEELNRQRLSHCFVNGKIAKTKTRCRLQAHGG